MSDDRDRPIYSCVVDERPDFRLQSYYWVLSLTRLGGVPPSDIFVHALGTLPAQLKSWLDAQGVNIVTVEPFNPAHPYFNKLVQFDTFKSSGRHVVLMDCDIAVAGVVPWPVTQYAAAAMVNCALPPASALSVLWSKAGLKLDWGESEFLPGPEGRETAIDNRNGGVYLLSPTAVDELGSEWGRWADFCLENSEDFGEYRVHADQVAFALALSSLGRSADVLPGAFNYPTHLGLSQDWDTAPHVLHYHRELDDAQLLRPTGLPLVDEAIARVNRMIGLEQSRALVNSVFWDYRYDSRPELGSGLGSRGSVLDYKRALLADLLRATAAASVLDVGCGDLETALQLDVADYTGVDVSDEALSIAAGKRPDWRFLQLDCSRGDVNLPEAEFVCCLDVLIHQSSADGYQMVVENLVRATGGTLVVGAYDSEPAFTSDLTTYHEPIRETLARHPELEEVTTVGRYRDVSVICAKRVKPSRHARDVGPADFIQMSAWSRNPRLLRCLADVSRRQLGFFPAHYPRAIEYPWVAECLRAFGPGLRIVDAGAGVSCLPLWLAAAGNSVLTVDSSEIVRTAEGRAEWNEWGFLDYATINPRVHSYHGGFESLDTEVLDAGISISVVEHLDAATRRRWMDRFATLIRPGGLLLLTVDLIANTDSLWPYAAGLLVEPEEQHGSLSSLVSEVESASFRVAQLEIVRDLPSTRVDVALLRAARV